MIVSEQTLSVWICLNLVLFRQMLIRHEKELEHHRRVSSRKEDELLKRQAAEKRALPKRIRSEMKIREMMFRESLRIHAPGSNPATGPEDEKDRLRKVKNFCPLKPTSCLKVKQMN